MNPQQASQQYLGAEVENADPLRRIVMLHERAARALREAVHHIEGREIEKAHNALVKAKQIVMLFLASVPDHDESDAAANLRGLLTYCYQQTVEGNLRKDPACARAALEVLTTLAEAWAELDARRRQAQAASPPDPQPTLEPVEA
jgi:flagellar protein FliS